MYFVECGRYSAFLLKAWLKPIVRKAELEWVRQKKAQVMRCWINAMMKQTTTLATKFCQFAISALIEGGLWFIQITDLHRFIQIWSLQIPLYHCITEDSVFECLGLFSRLYFAKDLSTQPCLGQCFLLCPK